MKYIKIGIIVLIVGILFTQVNTIKSLFQPKPAYAVGDLGIDWGVTGGNYVGPVFTITNLTPGQSQSKIVTVKNNASVNRSVSVRGVKTNETGNLATVLLLTITRNGTAIYGAGSNTGTKTLQQFFTESNNSEGIALFTQPSANTSSYTFTLTFAPEAVNVYQNKTTVFTLHLGFSLLVPEPCNAISFGGKDPIYGTQKSDIIQGTAGNDLIYALEGSDVVHGNGGEDCIIGGDGSDVLHGDAGNDTILGSLGSDVLSGGVGNDKLYGEDGSDVTDGGANQDTCIGEVKILCEL